MILYVVLIFSLSPALLKSQVVSNGPQEILEKLYGRLINNYNDSARVQINDSIRVIIGNYVLSDTVFTHRFTKLRYLGQITSPDSLVKIITWNLVTGLSPGMYFCYIIKKEDKGKKNRVYTLTGKYREESVRTDTTYAESDWYGALYYDIRPYKVDNEKFWILLGIDYGNPYISKKLIDVLSFTPSGSIVFGKKLFAAGDTIKFRDVFEYASNGMMSLRFRSDSSIVFDHLVPFTPSHMDDRQYYGPDYSYDAYNLKDGLWRLTINVDVRNKE